MNANAWKIVTSIQQKAFDEIPRYALGESPDDLHIHKYRLVIIKRALEAGYEEVTIPETIIDILADIRHLCDEVGLDFGALDKQAYTYYIQEDHE